jgi:hypothetical protein
MVRSKDLLTEEGKSAPRGSHVRAEVPEWLQSRMDKKMAKVKQPAAQLKFEGIQGC